MLVFLLGFLELVKGYADIGAGLFIARVQWYAVFDVDAVAFFTLFCHFNIIADLALEANVRHKAIAGLGVDARHIARIGITVRIAVFHVEQHHKFITVLDGIRHFLSPPFCHYTDDSNQDKNRLFLPARIAPVVVWSVAQQDHFPSLRAFSLILAYLA